MSQSHDGFFAYYEEGKPLLLLDLRTERPRRTRPRTRVTGAVAGAMAMTVAAFVTLAAIPASSAALPAKVLQAVDLTLGNDGALRSVTSTNVRRTTGAKGTESSTDTLSLDPRKVVGQLPVRVLTSYRLGDRTGTDLAELRGKKGRVEITLTVQNTTVRPQLLTYDVDSVPQRRYALVGTPLTVTASALLPKGAFTGIVPAAAAAPSAGATTGTNGVVGRLPDGGTTVQWAALLAPPQLAASTQFTLVQDATDFQVPQIDLSVQPGLATDASVQRLLTDAFRKDGSSRLNLELKTLQTISQVSGVLGSAGVTLGRIQQALNTGADTLGNALIGKLADSTQQVLDASTGLSSGLDQLSTGLSSALTSTNDATVQALLESVTRLSDYLGRPDGTRPTALPVRPGCQVDLAAQDKASTLYAQLYQVSGQLETLAASTQGCQQALAASLLASLGDPADCPAAAAPSGPVACTLTALRDQLTGVATYLATTGASVLAQFQPSAVSDVGSAVTALTTAVTNVQAQSAALGEGTTPTVLRDRVAALQTTVEGLLAGLRPSASTGLASALRSVRDLAQERLAELGGPTGGAGSLSGQARAVAAALCATPSAVPFPTADTPSATAEPTASADPTATGAPDTGATVPPVVPVPDPLLTKAKDALDATNSGYADYVRTLRALVSGTSCSDSALPAPAGYPRPLVDRIDAEYGAWATVVSLTDVTASTPKGPAKETAALTAELTAVRDALASLASDLDSGRTDDLASRVAVVRAGVGALYAAPTTSGTCPSALNPALPALNALAQAFTRLDCNQRGLGDRLSALLAGSAPTYAGAAAGAADAAERTGAARLQANASLAQLLGTLNGSLRTTARTGLDQGTAVVTGQRKALADQGAALARTLDAATKQAVATITQSIAASNRDLRAATDLLAASLKSVQLDLGTGKDSRGLLGVLVGNASLTGSGAERVQSAADTANRFGGVRGFELSDVLLQQAQFLAALEQQAAFPAFALDLPPGSVSTTVFSFHLRSA